jgi:hypothetical protein
MTKRQIEAPVSARAAQAASDEKAAATVAQTPWRAEEDRRQIVGAGWRSPRPPAVGKPGLLRLVTRSYAWLRIKKIFFMCSTEPTSLSPPTFGRGWIFGERISRVGPSSQPPPCAKSNCYSVEGFVAPKGMLPVGLLFLVCDVVCPRL